MPDPPSPAPEDRAGPVTDLIERTRELIRRTQEVLDSSRRQLDRFRRSNEREAEEGGEKEV